jgi:hypothetical protein
MPTEIEQIRALPEPFAACPAAIDALESGDDAERDDAIDYFRDLFLAYQGAHHERCVLLALPKIAAFIDSEGPDEEHQAALADVLFSYGERLETHEPKPEVVAALKKHFPMALDPPQS